MNKTELELQYLLFSSLSIKFSKAGIFNRQMLCLVVGPDLHPPVHHPCGILEAQFVYGRVANEILVWKDNLKLGFLYSMSIS